MSKAKLYYLVDTFIVAAFILAALSGLILFFVPSGYQGGRNPYYGQAVLLLTTHTWTTVHTWSGIVMIAGIVIHVALHWNWIVHMTKKWFQAHPAQPNNAAY